MAWEPISPFGQTVSGKPQHIPGRRRDNTYTEVSEPKLDKQVSLVTDQQVEFYNEFRAVYTTPASLIESDEDRKRGYITHRTAWFRSAEDARKRATIRSEENHAIVVDIEMSWVTRSKPESIGC
jgi:hypothetical protein